MSLTLTLAVRDLDRTEYFYDRVLGLPLSRVLPAPGHPPVLLLQLGDCVLCFRDAGVMEAMHPALLQNFERHAFGVGMNIEIALDDIAPLSRRLDREEVRILYELDDEEFGRKEIWVHDPDGYLLVLMQEPEAADAP